MPAFPLRVAFLLLLLPAMAHAAQTLYLGTYTGEGSQGIYRLTFDPATGTLTPPVLAARTPDPSFLAFAPDGLTLYAVNEHGRGSVSSFAVEPSNGLIAPLNRQPVADGETGPCHLAVSRGGRMLVVANYALGSVAAFPLLADGRIGERSVFLRHSGLPGPRADRQKAPHAHEVLFSPDQRRLYVPDLGLDRVIAYTVDATHAELTPDPAANLVLEPGAGPRHAIFTKDGKFLYVADEIDNTITVAACDPRTGRLTRKQSLSIIPATYHGVAWTAEIQMDPHEYNVYASVRGTDMLVVLDRDPVTGRLRQRQTIHCGGSGPRSFTLSPDGNWLICANQGSRTLTVFDVDPFTGRLTRRGAAVSVPSPTCVLFAPTASHP